MRTIPVPFQSEETIRPAIALARNIVHLFSQKVGLSTKPPPATRQPEHPSESPMNIVIAVTRFHSNLTSWVKAFQSRGHRVAVLVVEYGPSEDHSVITPERMDLKKLDGEAAGRLVARLQPDLLILRHKDKAMRHLVAASRRSGAKTLFYEQLEYLRPAGLGSAWHDLGRLQRRWVRGYPLRSITPSMRSREGVPRFMARFFHFPMQPYPGASERPYCPDGRPRVICIGKLARPKKRHLWAVRALEELGRPYQLTIVGSGFDSDIYPDKRDRAYYDELRATVRNHSGHGQVTLHEDFPPAKMADLYLESDILVLPSAKENFGVTPLEAMAAGCAVLSTDNNGSAGYIEPGHDGLLFRNGDYDDFKAKLASLVSEPDRVAALGGQGLRTLEEKHNYRAFVSEILASAGLPDSAPPPPGHA